MVRPILEYASIVWSPHIQCDIHKIEMLQRRAIRFIFNNFSRTASVTNMLANLQLLTLECKINVETCNVISHTLSFC